MADVPELPLHIIHRIITMAKKLDIQPVLDELMEYHRNDPKEWVESDIDDSVMKTIKPSFKQSLSQTLKKYGVAVRVGYLIGGQHLDHTSKTSRFCKHTYDCFHFRKPRNGITYTALFKYFHRDNSKDHGMSGGFGGFDDDGNSITVYGNTNAHMTVQSIKTYVSVFPNVNSKLISIGLPIFSQVTYQQWLNNFGKILLKFE